MISTSSTPPMMSNVRRSQSRGGRAGAVVVTRGVVVTSSGVALVARAVAPSVVRAAGRAPVGLLRFFVLDMKRVLQSWGKGRRLIIAWNGVHHHREHREHGA